jgi:hypothetical protein
MDLEPDESSTLLHILIIFSFNIILPFTPKRPNRTRLFTVSN